MSVGIVTSANATTFTFSTLGDLQAVSTLSFTDDFQSYVTGSTPSFGAQGITFTQMEPGSLDVSIPADIANPTKCATIWLNSSTCGRISLAPKAQFNPILRGSA